MPRATPAEHRRPSLRELLADHWLLGMIAAGLLIRVVLVLLLDGEMDRYGDERTYVREAKHLLRFGTLETGNFVRPPLYIIFLSFARLISSPATWLSTAKLLQCVAAVLTAVPVYRTAFRIGGRSVARLSAAFLLFDPTLIAFSHLLWPETLFLFLVVLVFDGTFEVDDRSTIRSISLGAVTGLAMLLKPVFGLFTLCLAASWVSRLGFWRAVRVACIFGGATALVIAPWVVRNQLRYGPSIVLENQGAYNLWVGNSLEPGRSIVKQWRELGDPVERSRAAAERGIAAIEAEPERFLKNVGIRALNFWGLEYFVVRHLALGGYPTMERGTLLTCFWIIQSAWVLALLAAALGLGPLLRDRSMRPVLVYTGLFIVIVSTMVVTTRFRVPFMFWISIAAGLGVERLRSGRIGWRSLVVTACAVAILVFSASRPVFQKFITGDFEKSESLVNEEWRFFRY